MNECSEEETERVLREHNYSPEIEYSSTYSPNFISPDPTPMKSCSLTPIPRQTQSEYLTAREEKTSLDLDPTNSLLDSCLHKESKCERCLRVDRYIMECRQVAKALLLQAGIVDDPCWFLIHKLKILLRSSSINRSHSATQTQGRRPGLLDTRSQGIEKNNCFSHSTKCRMKQHSIEDSNKLYVQRSVGNSSQTSNCITIIYIYIYI